MRITNHFAIIRNLRNIQQAGVSQRHLNTVQRALRDPAWADGARRILPFRYVAAARAAPMYEPALDVALGWCIAALPMLPGRTVVLVDVSESMTTYLSGKSDMTRMDAAATLASVINAASLRVFTFSNTVVEVPPRRGMAGVDAIRRSQTHSMTRLAEAVALVNSNVPHDRLIVITDEQMHPGHLQDPVCEHGYVINVASAQHGVGYGKWTHLDGMSEQVIRWIIEYEGGDSSAMTTDGIDPETD